MAYTLAVVQARIALLEASYDELAARYIKSYSIADRETVYQDMAKIRDEIDYWNGKETSLSGNVHNSVAYAHFSDPR